MNERPQSVAETDIVGALVDAIPVALFAVDDAGAVVRVEATDENPLGFDPDAVGRPLDEFETAVPDLDAHCWRALSGERVETLVRRDGATFEFSCVPIRDGGGTVVGALGTALELAAQRAERQGGTATDDDHGTLLEQAPVMVAITRREGDEQYVTDCNRLLLETLGYDYEDVLDRPLADLYATAPATKLLEGSHGADADDFIVGERTLQTRDGRTVETLVHAVPETDADGDLVGTRALYVDLSEHKRIQRELRGSKDKIEKLHRIASEMMTCRDEQAVCDLTVEAAEEILEFDICGVDTLEDGYFIPRAISTGMTSDGYTKLPADEGIAGKTLQTGESHLVTDVRDSESAKPAQDEYRSILSVPVGEMGVFQAGSKQVEGFDEEDVDLAELLVSHVTEALSRVRSQAALRESEQKYRTLVEQSTEGIYIYRGSEFLFVNERATEIAGYSKQELYEMPVWQLLHPDDRERVLELAERRARGESVPPTYEARVRTADGDVRHCEFSVTEITYEGEPALLGTVHDITARKEREETLNSLQEATRELMRAKTTEAVATTLVETAEEVLDLSFGVVWFAGEGRETLRPVARTERARKLPLPEAFEKEADSHTWRAYLDREVVVSTHIQKSERSSRTSMRSMAFAPLGGHGVFALGSPVDPELSETQIDLVKLLAANAETALDRAEREHLLRDRERELARQNEKLEFLNSLLRHNILNGMTVILGRARLLEGDASGEEANHLETMLTWGEDVVDLIQKMRTLMESVVGETPVEPVPVELAPILEAEVEKVRTSHERATVTVDIEEEVVVRADEMLPEVFENLLSNAVSHNDTADPHVEVSVTVDDQSVVVDVSDDGPGIPDDKKAEIFGKGDKGPASPGTGYGLYLVHTIVDQYGGDVWVEDGDPGARFRVELPRSEDGG